MQWRAAAPGLGLSILARNQLFVQLSTLVVGSTFIGTGFQRVSSSFLQKYIRWPKSCNNLAFIIGCSSSIIWAGGGLSITHRAMGDVGSLGLALWAGALYMLCFACVTQQWQVYILNAVLLGPQALAFPAISAIKSRLVAEHEQGLLQGALTTGKSIAECIGPILFGFLFEAFSRPFEGDSGDSGHSQFASRCLCCASWFQQNFTFSYGFNHRIPILIAFLLCLPLLCLTAVIPQKLANFEQQLLDRTVNIEMENLEAEDVSLLDPSQRDKLL
ncbi:unnamed protein product [Cladocopium goreaui]|uniref:Hippocampus abundant transcript 1 protein n=1 Tax=Cladocopium goreaui TaxID=2562237 RepID=A0A9P1DC72_9DINO|nr:unnamed protein product [Cladocopium goreaui]